MNDTYFTASKIMPLIRAVGILLGISFVVFVYFGEDPIDKELTINSMLEACHTANMKIVSPESFLTEEDIAIINQSNPSEKQPDGTILSPLEIHIKTAKSNPIFDCDKLKEACERDFYSLECRELSSAAM